LWKLLTLFLDSQLRKRAAVDVPKAVYVMNAAVWSMLTFSFTVLQKKNTEVPTKKAKATEPPTKNAKATELPNKKAKATDHPSKKAKAAGLPSRKPTASVEVITKQILKYVHNVACGKVINIPVSEIIKKQAFQPKKTERPLRNRKANQKMMTSTIHWRKYKSLCVAKLLTLFSQRTGCHWFWKRCIGVSTNQYLLHSY
jgi:hypothetical protein